MAGFYIFVHTGANQFIIEQKDSSTGTAMSLQK